MRSTSLLFVLFWLSRSKKEICANGKLLSRWRQEGKVIISSKKQNSYLPLLQYFFTLAKRSRPHLRSHYQTNYTLQDPTPKLRIWRTFFFGLESPEPAHCWKCVPIQLKGSTRTHQWKPLDATVQCDTLFNFSTFLPSNFFLFPSYSILSWSLHYQFLFVTGSMVPCWLLAAR